MDNQMSDPAEIIARTCFLSTGDQLYPMSEIFNDEADAIITALHEAGSAIVPAALVEILAEYLREYDTPAPDYGYRITLRKRLVDMIAAAEEQGDG